jgi:hypothetical protein
MAHGRGIEQPFTADGCPATVPKIVPTTELD